MTTNETPAPRDNAGSRANSKIEGGEHKTSAIEWEADPVNRRPGCDRLCESLRISGPINFAEINRAALAAFPAVLAHILPSGKRVGAEIVAINPRRADRRLGSFKINRYNGRWADFATGDRGGDPISLVAYLADISQAEAARLLAQMLGVNLGGVRSE